MPVRTDQRYEVDTSVPDSSISLPDVIGLPPDDPRVLPSGYPQFSKVFMPIMTLVPKLPKAQTDFSVYHVRNAVQEYNDILSNLIPGLTIDRALKVAFLLENSPSETFNTEYGESFLESISGAVSTAAADIAFITGTSNIITTLQKLSDILNNENAGFLSSLSGKALGTLATGMEKAVGVLRAAGLNQMARIVPGLLAGNRVDFPQVWKGSSFEPSYSVTVRLYNPCPEDPAMTLKYIVAPLAALLLFVIPQIPDDQEYMYKYPFLCSFKCPGLFEADYGAISSINVIKGGDQSHIAYNQVPGMIDLRIDFHELFSTMVVRKSGQKKPGLPTLKEYLETIIDPHTTSKVSGWKQAVGAHRPRASQQVLGKEGTLRPVSQYSSTSPLRQSQTSGKGLLMSETPETSSRVSNKNKLRSDDLSDQMPSGVIV